MGGIRSSQSSDLWPAAATAALLLLTLAMIALPRPAQALPSFARQTGQPCGFCHTDMPGLTPAGRRFKLGGYTLGGGEFRTTPIPASSEPASSGSGKGDKGWFPPVAMMTIVGFTHTQAPLPPPTAPFQANDNVIVSPVSGFYAGAISEHVGAFAQVTYDNPPGKWTWDNIDLRYANTAKLGGLDVLYGITANNNPTVQDVWNTTPAWVFPYAASTIAPTPVTHTIIDGTFAAHVGSVGGYVFINDALYLETTAYKTLDPGAQTHLGVDPFSAPGLFESPSPYWRVAFEPHVGNHWLEIGTFGMFSEIHPWIDSSGLSGFGTFPQTDKFTDIGVDTQYQYQGENYWFTLRGSYIHEHQKLDASFANGRSSNPVDTLNTARAQASLAYGADNRIVLTGQYFNTWGSPDVGLYGALASGFSPNSDGWVAEITYIPFMSSKAPLWPWSNVRIGLQYTWYNKFDGTSVGASANNTLFLYAWFAL